MDFFEEGFGEMGRNNPSIISDICKVAAAAAKRKRRPFILCALPESDISWTNLQLQVFATFVYLLNFLTTVLIIVRNAIQNYLN